MGEIAEILNTTPANVNSYLPYERIIYRMEERSVEADRQARYTGRIHDEAGLRALDAILYGPVREIKELTDEVPKRWPLSLRSCILISGMTIWKSIQMNDSSSITTDFSHILIDKDYIHPV